MAVHIDRTHLREKWLPRLDHLLSSARFAENRYRVQRVYVCATVLSQDESEIRELLATLPSFSVTQENLDWQPEDGVSEGRVYQHLMQMGASSSSRPLHALHTLFENVESSVFPRGESDNSERLQYRQSFRLSSLEVCNAPGDSSPGYHIGATAFQKLTHLRDGDDSDEKWSKWLFEYIVEHDAESPRIVWDRDDRVISAVLWQVQLDILDSSARGRSPSCSRSQRGRYGPLLQVYDSPGDASANGFPKAKFRGVRHRHDRKSWVAEMRLPNNIKRNKVSFGDFKSEDEAARAVDAAFHYYGKKGQFNFADSPQILLTRPLPVGLNEETKLKIVKERVKWLAMTKAPTPRLPSSTGSPSSVTAEIIPDPTSSRSHTAFPTISSKSDGNGGDGAVESTPVESPMYPLEELNMSPMNELSDHHGQTPENYMLQIFEFSLENEIFPGSTDYLCDLSAISSPTASTFIPMDFDGYDLWY